MNLKLLLFRYWLPECVERQKLLRKKHFINTLK
jgi:hypothetical protein